MVMGIGWTGWIEQKFACGSWGGGGGSVNGFYGLVLDNND